MAKIFREVDEGEDAQSMFSSVDIQEYWDNIKRTAHAENKIISDLIDKAEDQEEQKNYPNNVLSLLKKEKVDEDGQQPEPEEDLDFNSPRNEFERMLHRKIFELNKLQTDYHKLQLENQKEK